MAVERPATIALMAHEGAKTVREADPEVSEAVKSDLEPCVADEYPVDVTYGDLTGGSSEDLVVNVMTCTDAVGVASYVYREDKGRYRSVFLAEQPPVYAEIDRGDLLVTRQLQRRGGHGIHVLRQALC